MARLSKTIVATRLLTCLVTLAASTGVVAKAAGPLSERLAKTEIEGLARTAIGVTRLGTPIYSFQGPADRDPNTQRLRILLVGGLDGTAASVDAVLATISAIQMASDDRLAISAVPCANPDGIDADMLRDTTRERALGNASGGDPSRGYPPKGPFYSTPTDPEAAYLWRWIGMHSPDLVVEIQKGKSLTWTFPKIEAAWVAPLRKSLGAAAGDGSQLLDDDSLVAQLPRVAACETGVIPAVRATTSVDSVAQLVEKLVAQAADADSLAPSPARRTLQARLARTPLEVARQLNKHYGQELGKVEYIPALALVGRLRLGELTNDPSQRADVERIVAPYFEGEKPTTPTSGSGQSGHLIFSELAKGADGAKRDRYVALARVAADQMFDKDGRMRDVMPSHNEMSDALFMGGPILAAVGRLTGEQKYYDGCARHLRFMQKLVLREDGLYRHSPLDEAAWGRGNGFPALGLALVLNELPEDHPARLELLQSFQRHMNALVEWQDASGCWHQVIDREESYREFTSTAMISFAMLRGMRSGWLDRPSYEPVARRAWNALRLRISDDGRLVDVCTGTGKQKSLRDYYDRDAILGRDARGGAMAFMISTEWIAFEGAASASQK